MIGQRFSHYRILEKLGGGGWVLSTRRKTPIPVYFFGSETDEAYARKKKRVTCCYSDLCTILFEGYGFGLFGRLQRWQLYLVLPGVWLVQLVASPIWLRHFRFGPLEWVWRSLTYWRIQPMLPKNSSLSHTGPVESSVGVGKL